MTFWVTRFNDCATFFWERDGRFAFVDSFDDGDVWVSFGGRFMPPAVIPSTFPACFGVVREHLGQ